MVQDLDVDVRGLPVWERPGRIFERFDQLALGETVAFLTENEPRGLAGRIEQHRPSQARVETMRVGDGEWRISLTRVDVERAASTVASVIAVGSNVSAAMASSTQRDTSAMGSAPTSCSSSRARA